MTEKKFIQKVISAVIVTLIIMGILVYLWDPYGYYRIRDNRIMYVASAYIDAGIIKNADYDSAIIGSSMSQNFNPETFRRCLGINPVKICTGGLTLEQRDLFYETLERSRKKRMLKKGRYFVEIGLSGFNSEDDDMSDTPLYLYDDNTLNDYRYLLGYETWMRAMPVSAGYALAEKLDIDMDTRHNIESIDNVGDWYTRYELGRDRVIKKYKNKIDAIAYQNTEGMYERMCENVDKKLTGIIDDGNEYVMYFPPYSVLFWCYAKEAGYADVYLSVKQHILDVLSQYDNVRVYDFQSADFITDLDNYRDSSHYGRHISELMAECFAGDNYLTDEKKAPASAAKLKEMMSEFEKENESWMKE